MVMLEFQYGYFFKINMQGFYILENKNIERMYIMDNFLIKMI